MVVQIVSDSDVDLIFQALADATRRDIVSRVMAEEQSVTSLAREYAMSFAAVQKHVAVLERARLIRKVRRGREQLVHGDPATLHRATQLLDAYQQIWRARADRMTQILNEE